MRTIDKYLSTRAEAREIADAYSLRYWIAEVSRRTGELLLERGDAERARECFAEALEIAGRQGARILQLRAAMSIARQEEARGDKAAARDAVAPVLASFPKDADFVDIRRARDLAHTLGAAR